MAFLLTQVIEISVGCVVWRDPKVQMLRKICIIFGASLITHPIVWFVFPKIQVAGGFTYEEYLLMAETYAYGVEIFYYYVMKLKRPILLSVVANTCSFLTGVLIYAYVL